MTWIKICGTTNLADALQSVAAGADALGFVFHEKSPRAVEPSAVREIVEALPQPVEKVGVFVDMEIDRINEIVREAQLTAVQIYGEASLAGFRRRWEKEAAAPKLIAAAQFEELAHMREVAQTLYAVLLDSGSKTSPGGTGRTFDWEQAAAILASSLQAHSRFIIAGGLNPANVGHAMRILKPWGVDVVSGVEASPGKKDPAKLKAFIDAVRRADGVNEESVATNGKSA